MYNVDPPMFPDTITDNYFKYTTYLAPGFSGLQIRNGPYGAISSKEISSGLVHFCCKRDFSTHDFLNVVRWVGDNSEALLELALKSFVDQYWEMRDLVIECLIDENPDDVVPEIESYKDLKKLCGIVAIHIKESAPSGIPKFGIEFGCTWEDEHGAGCRFEGLEVIRSGHASDSFSF